MAYRYGFGILRKSDPCFSSLDSSTYEPRIDGDPSVGTDFAVFDPIKAPFAAHALGINATANGAGTVARDSAKCASLINVNSVAQNSWNCKFFYEPTENLFLAQLALFDPNAVSSYRIELEAFRDGASVASTGINIDVAPDPAASAGLPAAGRPWRLGGVASAHDGCRGLTAARDLASFPCTDRRVTKVARRFFYSRRQPIILGHGV